MLCDGNYMYYISLWYLRFTVISPLKDKSIVIDDPYVHLLMLLIL